MNKLPCEVIRDLLPSYTDHLTSDLTTRLVEGHLEECADCRDILTAMRGDIPGDAAPQILPSAEAERASAGLSAGLPVNGEERAVDFLKKNRRINRRILLGSLLGAMALVFLLLFIRLYCIGDAFSENLLACEATVNGSQLTIDGTVIDSIHGISDVSFDESDGVITISTRAVLASPLHSGTIHEQYTAAGEIRQVRLGSRILWDDGTQISSLASNVYETRHDYIGDMPANSRTSLALNLSGYLGPYENELFTDSPPYTWELKLQQDFTSSEQYLREGDMDAYACVLLAVIDNLEEVRFTYTVDGSSLTRYVTSADASAYFGQDIKDCGRSVRLLDELLDRTGLNHYAYAGCDSASSREISFTLVNNTDAEVRAVEIDVYRDGDLRSTQGGMNADGSPLYRGETLQFDFLPENFGITAQPGEPVQTVGSAQLALTFTVETADGQRYTASPEQLRISGEFTELRDFVLTGNAQEGFRVSQ